MYDFGWEGLRYGGDIVFGGVGVIELRGRGIERIIYEDIEIYGRGSIGENDYDLGV